MQSNTYPPLHIKVEIAEDGTFCGQLIEYPAIISIGDTMEILEDNIRIAIREQAESLEEWVKEGKIENIRTLTFV